VRRPNDQRGRTVRLIKALLCATALVSTCSALAADLPTNKAPPAPTLAAVPAYSWTGFYIGAGGGGAYMRAKDRSSSSYSTSSFSGYYRASGGNNSDLGKWGAFGTVEAGADYQMDRFVVGAFTNFDFKNLKKSKSTYGTVTGSGTGSFTVPSARHSVWYKVGNSWDAGVRLGYLVTDRNLVYGLGGYSGAQISSGAQIDVYNSGGARIGSFGSSESGWKSGWMLGAGWENAITDHVSFKLEYRYADYGKAKSSSYASSSTYARQSGDVSVQTVRASLDYKF